MGQPAARVGDMHLCPMFDGPKPHVGGPILPIGVPNVLIGGLPAATVGTLCACLSAPDRIIQGSFSVKIGGRPAARMFDRTAHGGMIVWGCPTVLIGDFGMTLVSPPFIVADMIAIPPKNFNPTFDVDRKLPPTPVIQGAAAQIRTAIAAAQSGSPFMEKC